MQVQVLKENLHKAVGLAGKFASVKAQLPVLSHIVVRAEKAGLFFAATNLELGIQLRIGGKILEEGAVAVPARVFGELVAALPLGTIALSAKTSDQMALSAGKIEATLQTLGTEDFPAIRGADGAVIGNFPVAELSEVVSRVGFAVSSDESRPVLTGILWRLSKGELIGTDGYRLSIASHAAAKAGKKAGVESVLVPGGFFREALTVLSELGEKQVEMRLAEKQKQIILVGEDVVLVGRLLEGEYPQFETILPKDAGEVLSMDRQEMLTAIKTAAIFARDSAHIVKLHLGSSAVVVSANAASVGENTIEVDAKTEGSAGAKTLASEQEVVAFNSRYLLDFLSHCATERVQFEFHGALKAGVFREAGSENFLHVIMPVRVREGE